ncbi:MAG: ATP-dependent DNA helicase RecG [Gemmataceae bacterium]
MSLATPHELQQPLTTLRSVSSTRQDQLRRLHITTIADLLFHFPRSYEDLTDVRPIAKLSADAIQTVQGEVVDIAGDHLPTGKTVVRIVLSDDGKNSLEGVWFNQPWAARPYRYGQRVAFSGKPKWYRDHWQMNSPRAQILDKQTPGEAVEPNLGIVPMYPLTEDLRVEDLRPLVRQALDQYADKVPERLPAALRDQRELPGVHDALRAIHFPATLPDAKAARRRFVYEEFLLLQLALALRRRETRDRQMAPRLPVTKTIDEHIRRLFPFQLTADQNQVVAEVVKDLASDRPMQRLLQADVGAGKTAVAVYALLTTVANKHQAALMAPTEVLARQHYRIFERYLAKSRVRRLLLTGALSARQRREALAAIKAGEIDLVVGTQALIQEDVRFARLGLVVIDEQHKFGVEQRASFRKLGVEPHYLVMTATPIPRTLALTVFGDLDVSTIRELPPGRHPTVTRWVTAKQREGLYAKLREELKQGKQGYVVCPLVEESETLDVKAAVQTQAELQAGPFRDFRVGLIHGRMEETEKDAVMQAFRDKQIDLLVSTTVVEVGVDVANATLLVVEHAERFGVSQLHQLRGRISRGSVPGQCYLFAEPASPETKDRLRAFVRTNDGFALAEEDARLRGGGELFGTRQHGLGELRFADPLKDQETLRQARHDAFALVLDDATLTRPEHALLRQEVIERYGRTLELAEIG